jgi:hypothetical protein
MLFQPDIPNFGWSFTNVLDRYTGTAGTGMGDPAPVTAATTYATPVVPTNTIQLATTAEVAYDVYGIQLCLNNYDATATIRNGRVRIMTSSNDTGPDTNSVIINDLLMGGCVQPITDFGGIWYYFPLFIPAGSSIWAQAIGSIATSAVSSEFHVAMWLFGRPKRPEVTRVGRYVDTFGITAATHTGTAITLGTTAEGNFTQIGSATTREYWWPQLGFSNNDGSTTNAALHLELAAGTSTTVNKRLIYDQLWITNTAEQVSCRPYFGGMTGFDVPIGSNIYGRGQSSTAADTGPSIAAYLLGG